MNAHQRITSTMLRFATWFCIILLAVLSLLPAEDMVRTELSGRLEHFMAYAGSATVTIGGYGDRYGRIGVIGFYWVYAGVLEYLQQFSPGRHVSIWDFAASALGAFCGVLAATLLARTLISWSITAARLL
jgi:VanZ family protein